MNKQILSLCFAVIFSFLLAATAQASLTLTLDDGSLDVYQDNSITSHLDMTSTVDTTVDLTKLNLPSGTTLVFGSPNPITLTANESKQINFTIRADETAELGEKTITINASSISENTSATFYLTIKRNFCEAGIEGNDLDVEIKEPDSGDDFYAGETISIEVNVDTNDEVDFDLYAELYDITSGEVIEEASLEDLSLDEEDDDYTIEIKVPYDIDTGDDYVINVKAEGENSDDDEQCQQDTISVEIKKRNHAVVLDKITYPDTLSCSMPLDLIVRVANAGRDDEADVKVKITSTTLNLSAEQTKDIDENDEESFSFSNIIPIVAPGKYSIRIEVESDNSEDAQTIEVNLQGNCKVDQKSVSILAFQQNQGSIGKDVVFKTTITNTGTSTTTYAVDVAGYQSWASLSGISQTQLTLASGESKDIIITLKPNQNAQTTNTFQIKTTFAGQIKTQDLALTLSKTDTNVPITGATFWSKLGTSLKNNAWLFIINVILVIIVIGLIILASTRPKKKEVIVKEERLKAKNGKRK